MKRRITADDIAGAVLSRAWQARQTAIAAGDIHANDRWLDVLRSRCLGREPDPPACEDCGDVGILQLDCTARYRCRACGFKPAAKRLDMDYTHAYAVPCSCAAGDTYRKSIGGQTGERPAEAPKTTSYGRRRTGGWRPAAS